MKDKETEFSIKVLGFESHLRLTNHENRVKASIENLFIDKLNYCRWKNALSFLDKYERMKAKRNLDGKETPLPPKYLFEILENAFIEDDSDIQELWAKLLLNWQDPNKRTDMRPVYISLIKTFTPTEAEILKLISKNLLIFNDSLKQQYADIFEDCDFSNVGYFISKKEVINALKLCEEEYTLSMLNLCRCMCLESVKTPFVNINIGGKNPVSRDFGLELTKPTSLGINLINNCIVD